MSRENKYLFRAPLLDPKQHVIGYKLAWQKKEQNSETSDEADSLQLLAFVAEHAGEIKSGLFFVDASPAVLYAEALQTLPPQTTVLVLKRGDLVDADHLALATSLRQRGVGLALRDVDLAFLKANELRLSHLSYVLICDGHPDLTEMTNFARHRQPPFFVVADKILGWWEFDACACRVVWQGRS